MPSTSAPASPCLPSAAVANDAIRRYVAGRTRWTAAELAELDRLRAVWVAAVRAEMVQAA